MIIINKRTILIVRTDKTQQQNLKKALQEKMETTSALSGKSLKVVGAHVQVLNYTRITLVLCYSNQSCSNNSPQRPCLLATG